MFLELLLIGSEVLEGETINTNAAFLSRQLVANGYDVTRHTVLPDDVGAIECGLQELLKRSKLVIATGGMGPTIDDVTLIAARKVFQCEGKPLENRVGLATGWVFSSKEGVALFLPGVPREMQEMFLHQALPYLIEHFPVTVAPTTLELSLCQINETDIDPLLRQIQQEHPDASIGIYPSLGAVKLRFRVKERPERLAAWQQLIQDHFRTHLFEAPSLQESLVQILIQKKKTLALAESCTGGALSARIVEVPDASKALAGSLVVYSNEWKESMLGVSHRTLRERGAVSLETACEMVEGLFERTDADVALSITGIAGPTGGSIDKPVGSVWFALGERGKRVQTKHILAAPPRANIIDLAVQTALGALFRRIAYGIDL